MTDINLKTLRDVPICKQTVQNVKKKTKGCFFPLNNMSYIITQHTQRVYILINLV